MPGWITPQQALRIDPEFYTKRGENAWTLDPDLYGFHSPFGSARVRVQTNPNGTPDFDRVVYGEAPNINAVVWGVDNKDIYKVAVVVQARPFADMPSGEPADPPIRFGQPCVMGFFDRIVGLKVAEAFESADQAALREAMEEAGAGVILDIQPMGYHNPNPTFVATWSTLLEIQVDLEKVTEHTDRSELIYRAEYLPVQEILARIADGEHEGVNYRSATANDAFLVWLARHPEALLQAAFELRAL